MQYYDETRMKGIREKVEAEVLSWKGVTTKKMFGCPCYKHKGKLFAFLVTEGLVITKLDEDDRSEVEKKFKTSPFVAGKQMTVKKWLSIPLKSTRALPELLPYLKRSYVNVAKQRSA